MRYIHTLFGTVILSLCLPACEPGDKDEDLDGDGWLASADCDDEDALVSPGADESKGDQIDNDCDGQLDCEDEDLAGVYVGDVGEADLAGLCDQICDLAVTGSVTLQGTALTDLSELSCLHTVGGDLTIEQNEQLVSLDGLEQLERVDGALSVGLLYCDNMATGENCSTTGNPALERIDSLGALQYVGNWLSFGGNPSLTTIADLDRLESVGSTSDGGGGLWFDDNPALTALPATPALRTVDGWLTVWGHDALVSLDGLESIEEVTGILVIGWDGQLADVSALSALTLAGGLWMFEDHALVSVTGLEALESSSDLWFYRNDALTSINALESLRTVSYLSLMENAQLVAIDALENVSGVSDLIVVGNPQITSLAPLSGITGELGFLAIWYNDSLSSLHGLEGISAVTGDAGIYHNPALGSLDGLANLSAVGGTLSVGANDALASLDGLEAMRTIGGNLAIGTADGDVSDEALADLDGLHGLSSVGADVLVRCGAALTQAEVDELVAAIDSIGGVVDATCD